MAEERKIVSVLFADIVGSTALGHDNDPEVVRTVLGRYFDRAREIVELHGGSVEKFIGDAVMAVFGVPRVHDDDAERAVRAALAIRDAIGPLNDELALALEARIGVNTGEAVAALDERDQRLVTGDVVNVAARLQQHAEPTEIVVGALTEQLSRVAIEYEPIEPITARGKPEPIAAFRALRARSDLPEQARGLPQMRARLVGRVRELTLLTDTFERARTDRRGQLFTLVGNAGVGKSRLVGEFLARVGGGEDVRVLRGRCLPYGAGITYWPFVELFNADLGVTAQQDRAEVIDSLKRRIDALIAAGIRVPVSARLAVLMGLAEASQAVPDVGADRLPAELGWAVGEYFSSLAAKAPLICVIDDLQWAEPAALEVVRELVEATADSAFLLLCIARPELLERNSAWNNALANATTIALEPLTDDETRVLIGRLLDVDDMPEQLRTSIVTRSGGNPLFCEEFVRMLIDEGRIVRDGDRWRGATADSFDVRVPESIQALLTTRLDGLPVDLKAIAQAASVIGEQLDARQLGQLVGGDVDQALAALVRAGFLLVDRAAGPGAYRFKHLLIRDVAYASLPKSDRARLHEAFGLALEAAVGDRHTEFVEILAHHAQQTLALSQELRQSGEPLEARARRALSLSLEAGRRAYERGNLQALSRFIDTARSAQQALGGAESEDMAGIELLAAQAEALPGNFTIAAAGLERAAELAARVGRRDLEADAKLALADVLIFSADDELQPVLDAALESAVDLYTQLGNVQGRLRAQLGQLETLYGTGRMTPMLAKGQALIDEALGAGERAFAARAMARLAAPAIWTGRTALGGEMAERGEALATELGLLATARQARFYRARLHWVRREFREAESILRQLQQEADTSGDGVVWMASTRLLAETFMLNEQPALAEPFLDEAIDRSRRTGERWSRTELLAFKSSVRAIAGDLAGAEAALAESSSTLRSTDYAANGEYQGALGFIRRLQGRDSEAEVAYRRQLEVVLQSDNWYWQLAALDLAEFLVERGRFDEAAPLVTQVAEAVAGTDLRLDQPRLERLQADLAAQTATRSG